MYRIALAVFSSVILGCSGAVGGEQPTSVPVESTEAPVVVRPRCAVEVHADGGWTERSEIPCPDHAAHLMVMGDVGVAGPTLNGSVAGARSICTERRCDLLLLAGDLIYGPGADSEPHWKAIWDDALAGLGLSSVAVLGNHEWRHEPEPEKKRAAVLASDGRAGLVAPGPSFALRVVRDGRAIFAVAGVDTDSVSNPIPEMPGLGDAALDAACGEGVPMVVVGHHPPTSQGLHHGHEAHVEKELRRIWAERRRGGCDLRLVAAGHDHDLQAYPPECEEADLPALVVSGVAGLGFRIAGEPHLPKCGPGPSEGRETAYFAGRGKDGGFAHVEVALGPGESNIRLFATPAAGGAPELLSTTAF